MSNKTIVPKPLKMLRIKNKTAINLEKWILYFKKLSPRILVKLPSDKDFNLSFYKDKFLEMIGMDNDNITIYNWPNLEEIAFVVFIDSSLQKQRGTPPSTNREYILLLLVSL